MTEAELGVLLRLWQRRLRLEDWDISLEVRRMRDMSEEGRAAEINWKVQTHSANLTICDLSDIDTARWPIDGDQEKTLVHELLHLRFPLHKPVEMKSAPANSFELGIERTAQALVNAYREAALPQGVPGTGT